MVRPVFMALVAALLSGSVFFRPAIAAGPTGDEQAIVSRTQDTVLTPKLANETIRGIVDSVDEGTDTVKIRLSPEAIEQLKVQDGLIFNAIRYGDQVEVTVQTIAGARTVVGLVKQ